MFCLKNSDKKYSVQTYISNIRTHLLHINYITTSCEQTLFYIWYHLNFFSRVYVLIIIWSEISTGRGRSYTFAKDLDTAFIFLLYNELNKDVK